LGRRQVATQLCIAGINLNSLLKVGDGFLQLLLHAQD
jgi:hypothetical protein